MLPLHPPLHAHVVRFGIHRRARRSGDPVYRALGDDLDGRGYLRFSGAWGGDDDVLPLAPGRGCRIETGVESAS